MSTEQNTTIMSTNRTHHYVLHIITLHLWLKFPYLKIAFFQLLFMYSSLFCQSTTGAETSIAMDAALTQRSRLEQANEGVDELLDIARTSMDGLQSQYSILKVIRIRGKKKEEEEEEEEKEVVVVVL